MSQAKSRRLIERLPEWTRLAVLPALISFVMLWPALLGLGVLAPTDILAADALFGGRPPNSIGSSVQNPLLGDVVDVFIPWKLYARSELQQGRFPLWNPYNALGTPFHANLQSQVLSPFNLLWLALPPLWGLSAITALKWTLAGLGMGLLLRSLGLGMLPAVFGSAALQLSGPMVGWLQWPIAEGLAWVPWMLWAALKWADTLDLRWVSALSLFVAAELLAGHIETTFHSLAFLGIFSLAVLQSGGFRWARRLEESDPRSGVKAMLGLLGAGVLGLGISAAQVLPFLDVLQSSYQWAVRASVQVQHISMPTRAGLMWLAPNGFGWPDAYLGPSNWAEANPYVGAVTLLLASWLLASSLFKAKPWRGGLGRIRAGLSPRKPFFWAGLLAMAISMAYGIPPLSLLRELPGFNTSFNSRLVSVAGPCMIVLAAMGLERLLATGRRTLTRGWAIVSGILCAMAMLFLLGGAQVWYVDSLDVKSYTAAWITWAGVLFCIGAALLLARLTGWLRPQTFGVLVLALLLVDMIRADWNFNPTSAWSTFYPKNKLIQFLINRGPEQRVAIAGVYAESNRLLALRVPDYRIYDPTVSNRYMTYARLLSPETFRTAFREQNAAYTTHMDLITPSAVQMAAVGIRWLVTRASVDPNSWQPQPPQDKIYEQILESDNFKVWDNRYAQPYVHFASRLQIAPDESIALRRMRALTIDRVNQVHIEAPGGALPRSVSSLDSGEPITQAEADSVKVEQHVPGSMTIRATAEKGRFLVVNESWAEGWRAEIDGVATPIYRVNYVAQSVVVPKGGHTITLAYDPPAFRWGVGISLVSVAGWLGLLFFSVRTTRDVNSFN